jgi:proteasome lid subunit RPN8/RPN11
VTIGAQDERHVISAMLEPITGVGGQALAERPNECCGLLAGVMQEGVGRVVRHYPLVNAAASPVLYESEPRSMFEAVRAMMREGLEAVAVYHSHPSSPPIPSKTDLARNCSEDVVNLIVSLASEPPLVRGWWLTPTDYREAEWTALDEGSRTESKGPG